MQLRKVTAASAAVLALALTATACGSDDKDDASGSGGGKKITIGIKIDQPGIGLKTPDGKYTGFDVDVATYVAKELGYDAADITFKETKSADRETSIERGDVKFIAASYSINDERLQKVDFAGPYLLAHQDILVRADDTSIKSPEDLNNKKLCSVSRLDLGEERPRQAGPEGPAPGVRRLLGVPDRPGEQGRRRTDHRRQHPGRSYASQDANKGKFKLAGFKMTNENYGIGLKKGDADLKKKINDALTKMVSDGSWKKAVDANFGPAGYKNEEAPKIGNVVK